MLMLGLVLCLISLGFQMSIKDQVKAYQQAVQAAKENNTPRPQKPGKFFIGPLFALLAAVCFWLAA